MAARTLHSSNTGLPGAFKAPPPPEQPEPKTLKKRDPFPRRAPSTPITSQQMPAAPSPSPAPPPDAAVAMPGGYSGGGGGGDYSPVASPAEVFGPVASSWAAEVTPTRIAIGVGALVAAALVYKAVRR